MASTSCNDFFRKNIERKIISIKNGVLKMTKMTKILCYFFRLCYKILFRYTCTTGPVVRHPCMHCYNSKKNYLKFENNCEDLERPSSFLHQIILNRNDNIQSNMLCFLVSRYLNVQTARKFY